ncbi:sodium-dependent glucose transporter 1-like [Ylistrum balloti]|uniref:sodium-dependent glucose transporter 1-like n=1 Tax=Ylistrum balloti TaxID=509963 RepID=UPI002905BFF6|nr:sodium-dependent glucose transporter 1-like [Ylistrum balloti]
MSKDLEEPEVLTVDPHTHGSSDIEHVSEEKNRMLKDRTTDIQNVSIIKEIKDDKLIRFNFILSILVVLVFMVLGWALAQIGPAFPDLVYITNTDLNRGSGYMTSYFTGRMVGSALGGVLYSKMNAYLMFAISLVVNGSVLATIPWCFHYEIMIAAHALHGISGGVLNVAVTSTAMSIWGPTRRGRLYVQILYAFLSVSSALAPIATAPFLREKKNDEGHRNISDMTTLSTLHPNISHCCFTSESYSNNTLDLPNNSSVVSESKLYIAYSISAVMTFLIAIPFIVLYTRRRPQATKTSKTVRYQFIGELPRIVNYLQLINVGVFAAVYSTTELLFIAYLTIFCVQYLQWSITSGALLTSVVMFATLGGRCVGIFMVHLMKSYTTLLFAVTLYAFGFVCLTTSAHLLADLGVWISVFIIGLPVGVIWPSALSWINSYLISVGGKVSSYLLVTGYLGPLLCPSLLGYLMQNVSLLWFCYLCVILSALSVLNVIFMVLHSVYSRKKHKMFNISQ